MKEFILCHTMLANLLLIRASTVIIPPAIQTLYDFYTSTFVQEGNDLTVSASTAIFCNTWPLYWQVMDTMF